MPSAPLPGPVIVFIIYIFIQLSKRIQNNNNNKKKLCITTSTTTRNEPRQCERIQAPARGRWSRRKCRVYRMSSISNIFIHVYMYMSTISNLSLWMLFVCKLIVRSTDRTDRQTAHKLASHGAYVYVNIFYFNNTL